MFLDSLLTTEEGNISYEELKMFAGQIMMESIKMETCCMAEKCRQIYCTSTVDIGGQHSMSIGLTAMCIF